MRVLLILLLFFSTSFARANDLYFEFKHIQSEKKPPKVNPQDIIHFSRATYEDTSVSVVSSLIGGAWLSQDVYVSIGFQEEGGIETYSFTVQGEILSVNYSRVDDNALFIEIKTSYGSFNTKTRDFNKGNTWHFLKVKKDKSTGNGFSIQGTLSTEPIDSVEDLN